jgi:hypothetical protein
MLNTETLTSVLEASPYVQALASWPIGIRTLVSIGLIERSSTLADKLWHDAMNMRVLESLEILLPLKVHISPNDWASANFKCYWGETEEAEESRWYVIFHTLALRLVSFIEPDPNLGNGEARLPIPTPYHYDCLSFVGAVAAWKAGFRDLNSAQWIELSDSEERVYGTPLWILLKHSAKASSSVMKWLLDHGADPFWIHPEFLISPAHAIVRRACERASLLCRMDPLDRVQHLLIQEQCDGCTCYCSEAGCYTIGWAISNYVHQGTPRTRRNSRRKTQSYLFNLMHENAGANWMSSAILRVLTFEKLSLTHTCCYRMYSAMWIYFTRPTPEEAQDIHDLERDDINLLDTLVKEFEAQWTNYNKPFVTFMNRVWRPRMRQVQKVKDEEAYEAEVRGLGVILEHSEEDTSSESDSDWPDDYVSEEEDDA